VKQCPECATYYLYRTGYEFIYGGSDEQQLKRLTDAMAGDYLKHPVRDQTQSLHGLPDGERVMGRSLVEKILAAAGQPVAGDTLSVNEMKRAVEEGRVLEIYFWSSMGDSEASFGFATDFGLDSEGRVYPGYLVFPRTIPLALRCNSSTEWEEVDEVFAAFGAGQSR
jgi:hypothetical protein